MGLINYLTWLAKLTTKLLVLTKMIFEAELKDWTHSKHETQLK